MGLFDFVGSIGKKIFGSNEPKEDPDSAASVSAAAISTSRETRRQGAKREAQLFHQERRLSC
jgi:hypothetical protein